MFNLPDDHHNFWHRMRAAPLARAVADLEFPFLPELSSSEALIRLRDAVVADFNLDRGSRSDAVSIADAGEPDDGANARYAFRSKDGYELLITSTNIALSQAGEHYADGENFARVFERVVAAFRSVFEAPRYTRLGVRYVNAAPATVEEWVAWFKPQFTGFIGDAVLPPESHRGALQIVQVQDSATDEAATSTTVRYGYLPKGIGPEITSRDASATPSFLADIDLASERGGEFEPSKIADLFRDLNHEIAKLFRYSLTEAGRGHFGLHKLEKKVQP